MEAAPRKTQVMRERETGVLMCSKNENIYQQDGK